MEATTTPVEREYHLVCADCGNEAHLVISSLTDMTVELLCWPDLMKRALQVAATLTAEEGNENGNT